MIVHKKTLPKSLVSLVIISCLGGCKLIPFVTKEKEQITPIDIRNDEIRQQTLEADLREFQALKPSIQRLAALESELSYLLEEVSRFNEVNPVFYEQAGDLLGEQAVHINERIVYTADGASNTELREDLDNWQQSKSTEWESETLDFTSANSTPSEVDKFKALNTGKKVADIDAKFSSASEVITSPAKPVMKVPSADKKAIADEITVQNPSPNTENQQVTNLKQNTRPSCEQWKTDEQASYSLHLASYSTRKAAQDGWRLFNDKHAQLWCSTQARLASVNVKGKAFLSLRLGAYSSKEKVQALCTILKDQGEYCGIAKFEGEIL